MRSVMISLLALSLTAAGGALAQQQRPGGMGGPGPDMGGPGAGMGPGADARGPGMGRPGQPPGMMGPYGYRGIDRNGDGIIAREELREHQQLLEQLQSNWEQADRNGDGRLDPSEFSAFEQSKQ